MQYLDPMDLNTASSAEELMQQYDQIRAMDDRTIKQKDYLINRSTTRYWLGQADSRNGLGNVAEYMLLDDFDAWYKHNRYESVQKQSYASSKMPWALAGDEEFFPDDLKYSDEYTKKWKGWYDDWKPMVENPVNAESYIRQNDKQTRVWNSDPAVVDAGWEDVNMGNWGQSYGNGETTGWGNADAVEGEDYTPPEDSEKPEDTSVTDPGYTDFFHESGGNSGWNVNWGIGSSGPPQEGMVWSNQAGRWVFPDPTPEPTPTSEPTPTVTSPPEPTPTVPTYEKKTPHLNQLGEYLLHEHMGQLQTSIGGQDISSFINQLPLTSQGELAIGGDDALEAKLNLPSDTRAVQTADGVETRADPYQASDISQQMQYHSASHTTL